MSYESLDAAKLALAALTSTGDELKSDLANIAKQVSIYAQNVNEGAVTVLYSGMIGAVHSTSVVNSMALDPNVRTVDKTIAADFLNSAEFRAKVAQAYEFESLDEFDNAPSTHPAKQWLFRDANGPWVNVSERFVEATEGKVRLLTQTPDTNGVLYKYELPKLLEKLQSGTGITEVDGIARDDLLKIGASYTTNWTEAMRSALVNTAITQTYFSKPALNGYAGWLNLTPDALVELHKNASAAEIKAWTDLLDGFHVPRAATRALTRLGVIGGIVSSGLIATQAAAAELNGDSAGARQIVTEWVLDVAGSSVGQIIGASVGAVAVAILGAAGAVLSAPVAGAIVIGAALLGGIFGADGALKLYEMSKDLDDNGRMDLLDKLGNLLFGVNYTILSPLPPDLNGQQLTLDATYGRDDMVELAKNSIAWRYALRELNPFVIPDISYTQHNTDGSLNLYDPETGEGAMSEAWLADRAAMLTWKIRFDRGMRDENDGPREGPKSYTEDWDTSEVQGNWDFVDFVNPLPGGAPLTLAIDGQGITLHDHQVVFGSAAGEAIEGAGLSDRLYGGGGDDTISGLEGADYVEGGAGADHLDGGAGHDVLHGGTGNDTYVFQSGHGQDVIVDADGLGSLTFDGQTISVGERLSDGSEMWDDTTGRYRITRIDNQTLRISAKLGQDSITIKNWSDGELGLVLGNDTEEPEAPETSTLYVGDQRAKRLGIEVKVGEVTPESSAYGYYDWSTTSWLSDGTLQGGVQEAGFADVISAAHQTQGVQMFGHGGNDALTGGSGADRIDGGNGNDLISGGQGADEITGGEGADVILSGHSLSLSQRQSAQDVYTPPGGGQLQVGGPTWGRYYDPATRSVVIGTGVGSSTANSGAGQSKGDHIDAGAGDDWVVGSDAADTVLGGQGSDVLDGGSGINNLFGGAGNDTYWVRTADLAQAAPPEGQQPTARTVIKDTEGRNVIRLDALRQNVELVPGVGAQGGVGLKWSLHPARQRANLKADLGRDPLSASINATRFHGYWTPAPRIKACTRRTGLSAPLNIEASCS